MEYTRNSSFGKTSWGRFQAVLGVTFSPCSRKSDRPTFQCLLLDDGLEPEWLEAKSAEKSAASHGERSTLNFGASPNIERGSSLLRVLEGGEGTYRYSLTPKACAGILRRVNAKGKKLPELLEAVLRKQAHDGSCGS